MIILDRAYELVLDMEDMRLDRLRLKDFALRGLLRRLKPTKRP